MFAGGTLCESSQWCRTWNSQWDTFRVKGVAKWTEGRHANFDSGTLAPEGDLPEGHDPCEGRPEIRRVTPCEPCVSLGP